LTLFEGRAIAADHHGERALRAPGILAHGSMSTSMALPKMVFRGNFDA